MASGSEGGPRCGPALLRVPPPVSTVWNLLVGVCAQARRVMACEGGGGGVGARLPLWLLRARVAWWRGGSGP